MMQDIVEALVPKFMKHFSVGGTLGILIGLLISLVVNPFWFKALVILYLVLSIVGLWKTKNDWKEHFS